jgi:hypothetical protein
MVDIQMETDASEQIRAVHVRPDAPPVMMATLSLSVYIISLNLLTSG